MSFDMAQHEKIRKCTKRAIERILFNYSLPANEIYEAVMGYQHDPQDLPTHDLKREFDIPDVKNRYSKALMNIVAEFCITSLESLSLEQMASAPKQYDEAYLKRRWKTQYEVFKAIFVDIPEPVERKKLFFSECILYSTLLATTHGRSISALNDRLETPSQKTRARKWLKSVAETLFSERMKDQFRTIVSWYIEDELLKEAEELGLSIIKRYLLPANKVVDRKNNLYRSVDKAERDGTDFPEERIKGATEEETMANIEMREHMKEDRYLYIHAAHDILMLAELIANHTIANNISCDKWEEDSVWFMQRLMESPVYPQYRKKQLWMISLMPQECTEYLQSLFGWVYSSLKKEAQIILGTAYLEDGVTNSRMQSILDLNSIEIGHILASLVEQGLLLASRKGRWTSYRLNAEFSIPDEQLHLDNPQNTVCLTNETDRTIYEYILTNGFITSHQILDITKITTPQGANIALGRLMDADLIEKIRKGRHFIYQIKK